MLKFLRKKGQGTTETFVILALVIGIVVGVIGPMLAQRYNESAETVAGGLTASAGKLSSTLSN